MDRESTSKLVFIDESEWYEWGEVFIYNIYIVSTHTYHSHSRCVEWRHLLSWNNNLIYLYLELTSHQYRTKLTHIHTSGRKK